ncbi:MAG: hypothetical protein M3Q89_06820, partial [Verrucomicrobiota bacterium]|nr:hypothetical protein [Verrucomicrobiota bacterium]
MWSQSKANFRLSSAGAQGRCEIAVFIAREGLARQAFPFSIRAMTGVVSGSGSIQPVVSMSKKSIVTGVPRRNFRRLNNARAEIAEGFHIFLLKEPVTKSFSLSGAKGARGAV